MNKQSFQRNMTGNLGKRKYPDQNRKKASESINVHLAICILCEAMKLSDAILGVLYKHENWTFQPSIIPDYPSLKAAWIKCLWLFWGASYISLNEQQKARQKSFLELLLNQFQQAHKKPSGDRDLAINDCIKVKSGALLMIPLKWV